MVNMLMWTVDLGSAALLTALEVAALIAFWFAEGLKQWAAGGARPPGATARLFLVLTVGPIGLLAVSYGFYGAGLPVACGSQALLAAALILLSALGGGTECARWIAQHVSRSCPVRERVRRRGRTTWRSGK
ncbi:hypothetical protein ACIA8E_13040 [Streptomyces sp. NPDC051664]|uniref:hypothetical protein n=1 Tax=Streptomyces sp. NPDC051664 TaxID=3365668 RepID=UPI0037B6F605